MNPETYEKADALFQESAKVAQSVTRVGVILCMPYPWLTDFSHKGNKIVSFGAQDASIENEGALTGEVSAKMLHNAGVQYVILGHSERRALGETDEVVAKKISSAVKAGLHPILCVGEKERDDHGEYLHFLRSQIVNSLGKLSKKYLSKVVIAYEPVWAIGQSEDKAMKPADIHETSLFIRKVLAEIYGSAVAVSTPILYGGSVNHNNARDMITLGEVQGLLVGRESLNPKKFGELLKNVD